MEITRKTPEMRNVDLATFRNEIVQNYRPVVLKGAVAHWEGVSAGSASPRALFDYFRSFDGGGSVLTFIGPPDIDGRFFYREDMTGINFDRSQEPITQAFERLARLLEAPDGSSVYVGSAPIPGVLPQLANKLPFDLVAPGVVPRIWIGTPAVIAAHYDMSDNLACSVGGRRRFTFIPPDQLDNLYVGPLEFTLAGPPCSMVSFRNPDFERYPKFREALKHAEVAELEPGDAVYIPYMWWHHVESFDPMNVLINYWWTDAQSGNPDPFECMAHGLLTIKHMPPERREVWRKMFEHYVFEADGDPAAHLAPVAKGVLGPMTPQLERFMRDWLARAMSMSLGRRR